MVSLRDKHEDPVEAVLDGLREFGVDPAEMPWRDGQLEPSTGSFDDPETYLREHARIAHEGFDWMSPEGVWESATELFDRALPTGFQLDWKWHAHEVAQRSNRGLRAFGYETTVDVPTSDRDSLEPQSTHPPSFHVDLQEAGGGEVVDSVTVRLPPMGSERSARTNHAAAAEALNRTVLDGVGLEIVLRISQPGDWAPFAVLTRERLDELQETYGPTVSMFGEPLLERNLLERALDGFEADNAVDHAAEFGVPEPPETFKLERLPEAEQYR